ncbi:MAG: hypothetical protein V1702_02655 [Candidatus Woesearchaeota archaeon]
MQAAFNQDLDNELKRLKTPQGKRFTYICMAFFVFLILFFILNYLHDLNRFSSSAGLYRPFGYISIFCAFLSAIVAAWYYKHIWKEPMGVDFLIPRKYIKYIYMGGGIIFVLIGAGLFIMDISNISKYSILGASLLLILGIVIFLYGK